MAYGDLSFFLPQQQYYRNPNDYTKAMKNAALQKAAYLAEMDINMQQLDEARRQFDERLGFDEASLRSQEAIAREQIGAQRDAARLNAKTSRRISDQQTKAANLGTLANVGLGLGKLGVEIWNARQNRTWDLEDLRWAEDQFAKSGGFGSGGYSFFDDPSAGYDSFSSDLFDFGSIDTSFGLDPFNDYLGSWSDPLLTYEPDPFNFDFSFF